MAVNTRNAMQSTPTDSAVGAVAITGAAQTLAVTGRAIEVTGVGDITFTLLDGSSMVLTGVTVGTKMWTVRSIASATLTGYVLL
jgi:hypothetical protein